MHFTLIFRYRLVISHGWLVSFILISNALTVQLRNKQTLNRITLPSFKLTPAKFGLSLVSSIRPFQASKTVRRQFNKNYSPRLPIHVLYNSLSRLRQFSQKDALCKEILTLQY